MSNIFNYKVRRFNKYIRAGFPASSINNVTGQLTQKQINYVTLTDDVIKKEKFKHNNYNKYADKIIDYKWSKEKIKYITDKLNENIFNPNIMYILNEMEKILCKINS